MDTKERIQQAALALFAQKGFRAATVREIAAQIGIKDSSLYFHYPNKQAILDALLERFTAVSGQMMNFLEGAAAELTVMTDDAFLAVAGQYASAYLLDNFTCKCIMLLGHEQSHDARMREMYVRWCIEEPVAFQAALMERLQQIGYLKPGDARQMAAAYYAPLFLYFHRYMNCEPVASDPEAFREAALASAGAFLRVYKKEA